MCLAPPRFQNRKIVIMGGQGVGKFQVYKLLSNDIVSLKDQQHSAICISDFNKIQLPQKVLDIQPMFSQQKLSTLNKVKDVMVHYLPGNEEIQLRAINYIHGAQGIIYLISNAQDINTQLDRLYDVISNVSFQKCSLLIIENVFDVKKPDSELQQILKTAEQFQYHLRNRKLYYLKCSLSNDKRANYYYSIIQFILQL